MELLSPASDRLLLWRAWLLTELLLRGSLGIPAALADSATDSLSLWEAAEPWFPYVQCVIEIPVLKIVSEH